MKPLTAAQQKKRQKQWMELYNPLRGLTVERARALLESYLRGDFAELMWAFGAPYIGIESTDPDLVALIERRHARLLEMDWDIRTLDDEDKKAKRQAKVLRDAYDRLDNLYEAIEHLAMATFRGFAHLEVDVAANELKVIPQWNVVRDGAFGQWAWNPEAKQTGFDAVAAEYRIDPERHWWIIREHKRPVGPWAMLKYFYSQLGTIDWATYCDIYGIPGGVVIGPPNVPEGKEPEYEAAGEKIAEGGSGYLPNGSDWKPNTGARESQPFQEWMEWLTSKLILAGTGGKLTMLTESGSGTLAGGAHSDAFQEIAAAEARKISECFQRQFDRRVLERAGLLGDGEKPLAWFEIAAQQETDTSEVIDDVVKLHQAGYRVDREQIEEKTGYQIAEEEEEGPALTDTDGHGQEEEGRGEKEEEEEDSTTSEPQATLKRQREAKDAKSTKEEEEPVAKNAESTLEDRIEAALAGEVVDEAALRALLSEISETLDERMEPVARALEEMLAEAVVQGASEGAVSLDGWGTAVWAANTAARKGDHYARDRIGRFAEMADADYGEAEKQENMKAGEAALAKAIQRKASVYGAMARPEIGTIDFEWGTPGDKTRDWEGGYGLSHIAAKHPDALKRIAGVIAKGKVSIHPEPNKWQIAHGRDLVIIGKRKRKQNVVITMTYTPRGGKA